MTGGPVGTGRAWHRVAAVLGALVLLLAFAALLRPAAPPALPDAVLAAGPPIEAVAEPQPMPGPTVAAPAPPKPAMEPLPPEPVEPAIEAPAEPPACNTAGDDRSGTPRRQWLAAMQSAADERQRAAGWLIGLVDAGDEAAPLRDRLATLAASSPDPLVQAYAWRACRGDASASSACQSLAPDAWARVEPDNAAAWLAVAVDSRLEPAAQADALRRAAAATRLESHGAALHALAQAAKPAGAGGLDRVMMARDIVEARADWLVSEALRQHCSARSVAEPARVPVCDAIAALLAAKAQSLPDLLEARETGQRVGWAGERLDALRDEEQALAALDRQRLDPPRELSCATLARQEAFYADVGRLGEVPALREALQRTPR